MAIALDAVGPSSSGQSTAAGASVSWSHTCTGSNLILLAGCAFGSSSLPALTASYGAQSMTLIGHVGSAGNTNEGGTYLFGLIAPTPGTATVTISGATGDYEAGSVSYTGCDQVTGWTNAVTASGTSGPGTGVITGTLTGVTAGDWVAAAACFGKAIDAGIATGTARWNDNQNTSSGAGNGVMGDSGGPASSSQTIAWSAASGNDDFGWVGVEIIAGGGGAAAPGPVQLTALPGRTWQRRFRHPQQLPAVPQTAATVSGDVALAATAAITASATDTALAAAAVTGTATITAAGTATELAAAAVAATATITATGTETALAAAAVTATATVTAAATATELAAASLTATATITATITVGSSTVSGDVALTATATITAAGTGIRQAAAPVTATATITAAAAGIRAAAAAVTETATITAAGTSTARGAASVATTAVITATVTVPVAFTVGTLTATDKATSTVTATGTASALTASVAAASTITAGDQRTGGPS